MPKKKTGARKKADKQKQRQKDINSSEKSRELTKFPCNFIMVSFLVHGKGKVRKSRFKSLIVE